MIVAKIYKRGAEALLAACDSDLLGKTLDGNDGVSVTISKYFYGDKMISGEELVRLLAQATNANLFGRETIDLAIREGFLDEEGILYIGEVPHAQIFMMI